MPILGASLRSLRVSSQARVRLGFYQWATILENHVCLCGIRDVAFVMLEGDTSDGVTLKVHFCRYSVILPLIAYVVV